MKDDYESLCMCALNKVFGYKPAVAHTLIEELGSAQAVWDLGEKDWQELAGPYSELSHGLDRKELDWAEAELKALERDGASFIHFKDRGYPAMLLECEDAPVGIYYKGCSPPEETFANPDPVAIVGTRDISDYGKEWCKRIVRSMAYGGKRPVVVSGLALGTDICAHQTALDIGLPTIAVMATGINGIYPWRHHGVASRIASTPGCALITDYPRGTSPLPLLFLRRNRIIAGMSRATILIESRIKGGGMMTANLSNSYNRDTYALPGRVDDLRSQGCNLLLRRKIAEPITDCESLLEALGLPTLSESGLTVPELPVFSGAAPKGKIDKTARVLIAIRRQRGISLDELSRASGLPFREIAAITAKLQDDGLISIDILQRCSIDVK